MQPNCIPTSWEVHWPAEAIAHLQHELAAVRAGRPLRMAGSYPGEIKPLVHEFNSVLEHNAEIVERARTQAVISRMP